MGRWEHGTREFTFSGVEWVEEAQRGWQGEHGYRWGAETVCQGARFLQLGCAGRLTERPSVNFLPCES